MIDQTRPPFLQAVAENRSEALEEARLAVEQIVLRRKQPIELLPRSPDVILLQVRAKGSTTIRDSISFDSPCKNGHVQFTIVFGQPLRRGHFPLSLIVLCVYFVLCTQSLLRWLMFSYEKAAHFPFPVCKDNLSDHHIRAPFE